MASNRALAEKMREYAIANKLALPTGLQYKNPLWGKGKRTLAWRVSGHLHREHRAIPQSTRKTKALVAYFFPASVAKSYPIRSDYHAVHRSGTRPLAAIKFIVLHDMEVKAYTTAAEAVGSYFQSRSSGGSTNYGVDNDSIQQYLADNVIPWGAPYVNTSGVHIEQMGAASWSTDEWKAKAAGTLERTAWLIAHLSKKLDIPIRTLTDAQVQAGARGVITHAQATRIFHVAGGHTDPGSGYPMAYVLGLAKKYR